ncbi:MAG: metallophosphoesterase [Acidobacteriales bacterium]|nr:metallophosphoesterase [Terriglobales bacterium]
MISVILALVLFQAPAVDPAAILAEADSQKRVETIRQLLRKFDKSMIGPMLRVGDSDPSPEVRKFVVDRLGRLGNPAVLEFLERHATTDPDVEVSVMALDQLRVHRARQLGQLFEKRLAVARERGDTKSLETLTAQHQRWVSAARGAVLPAFLQEPPPVFEAIPARKAIRVLAFSDFGTGGENMKRTAAAALAAHRKRRFDLGITIGDNILPEGVMSLDDPRWKASWIEQYDRLGIPIYAVTGNHDWGFADSPAAEILYSARSKSWRMPALYYTFTTGPVQFFALCTPALSEMQIKWLDRELGRSRARWKVVYGHYPIYSSAGHGDTPGYDKILLPILRNRANVYMAGHEHTMQHIAPDAGVHFIVNGAAGQGIRPAISGPRTLYAGSFYGYTVLEAGPSGLKVSFVDTAGKTQYENLIAK